MSVAIKRLTLSNFRSYRQARLDVDSQIIVLTGHNGAGKTNLLEAISFLIPGRGLRGAKISEVQTRDISIASGWSVASTIGTLSGPLEISTGRDCTQAEAIAKDRRIVQINGALSRNQAVLSDYLAVVWLTPLMERIFQDGASERRRFIDRLVFNFDPGHAGRLLRYEKALRERAKILEEGRGYEKNWLSALEDELARTGVAISAARKELVRQLKNFCDNQRLVSVFPRAELGLVGVVEDMLDTSPALAVENWLREAMANARKGQGEGDDIAAVPGPHRSDLMVQHHEKGIPAAMCSTGEQKALLISIILAHADLIKESRKMPPIMLMDEIAAHLDEERRSALFDALTATGCQIWMTGTDKRVFTELGSGASYFTIENGVIVNLPAPFQPW